MPLMFGKLNIRAQGSSTTVASVVSDVLVTSTHIYLLQGNMNTVHQYTKDANGVVGTFVRTINWYNADTTYISYICSSGSSVPRAYTTFYEGGKDYLCGWGNTTQMYTWEINNSTGLISSATRQIYSTPLAMTNYSRAGWDGGRYIYFAMRSNALSPIYRWDLQNKGVAPTLITTVSNNLSLDSSYTGSGLGVSRDATEIYWGDGSNESNGLLGGWYLSDGSAIPGSNPITGTIMTANGLSSLGANRGNISFTGYHRDVIYNIDYSTAKVNHLLTGSFPIINSTTTSDVTAVGAVATTNLIDQGDIDIVQHGHVWGTENPPTLYGLENVTFTNTSTGRTGTIQSWTAPSTGTYIIKAYGASGGPGNGGTIGGKGAMVSGEFQLSAGDQLRILVGQQGSGYGTGSDGTAGAGGGGSFVVKVDPNGSYTMSDNTKVTPLIIAAGGGGGNDGTYQGVTHGLDGSHTQTGAGTETNVGGSFAGTGTNAMYGKSFIQGGDGGTYNRGGVTNGGFGGGGTSDDSRSGGGGWVGGTSSAPAYSYNAGVNQSGTTGLNDGHGFVEVYAPTRPPDPQSQLGSTIGDFTTNITNLTKDTTYYLMPYIITSQGTIYGNVVSFETSGRPVIKDLTVTATDGKPTVTANFLYPGSPTSTNHGFCWSKTLENPTTTSNDGIVNLGQRGSAGTMTANILNLQDNTIYYVRAFATNTYGTIYSAPWVMMNSKSAPITQHGFCWATTQNPTTSNSKVELGARSTLGLFSGNMTGLAQGTTYYVRPFATTSFGTTYGNQVSFTTLLGMAEVSTQAATNVLAYSATGNGNVTQIMAGYPVTQHGHCWATTQNPTIANSKTTLGAKASTGAYTSSITGLSRSTTYYIRAYTTTSIGTSYGDQVSITTPSGLATITNAAVSSIAALSATGNGGITSLNGDNLTQHGHVWGTSTGPTIALTTKTTLGARSTTGNFTSSLTGLTRGTLYYVRSYATSTAGTVYGTEVNFTTLTGAATVTTSAATLVEGTTATGNGNVTALNGGTVSQHGHCWGTTANPTTDLATRTQLGAKGATGAFTSSLTGLAYGTTYNIRAYAITEFETTYGSNITFTTKTGLATVTTQAATSVADTTATGNGNITAWDGATATQYGHCWATTQNPTTANSKTTLGARTTTGAFTSSITGLVQDTTYYVRSYATTAAGTTYGSQVSFTTLKSAQAAPTAPVASSITSSSMVWTSSAGSLITCNGETKASGSTWSGLSVRTQYSAYAYFAETATHYQSGNSATTNATTLAEAPIVATFTPKKNVKNVTVGGSIIYLGGENATQHGHCWSTSQNPTTSSSKTTLGTRGNTDGFTSSINGLTNGTWYIRSYATNSAGTSYGEQVQVTIDGVIARVKKGDLLLPGKIIETSGNANLSLTTTGDIMGKIKEGPTIPSGAYHFPLGFRTTDRTRVAAPSFESNIMHNDNSVWIGTGGTNIAKNPKGSTISNATPGNYKPGWDVALHSDAITVSNWDTGWNSGVGSPAVGYHAKWVYEGMEGSKDPCMKFIDCNNRFGLGHRWLGISQSLGTPASLGWSAGTYVTISWYQKTDVTGKGADVGIYHRKTGKSGNEFTGSRQYITVSRPGAWERVSFTFQVLSDWDLNVSCSLYVYGYTGSYGTLWVDNVMVESRQFPSPFVETSISTSYLKYNFNQSIGLDWNSNWSIVYWKMPIGTQSNNLTGYSIESLGCNSNSVGGGYYWWGKTSGANSINGSSPDVIDPATYFGRWHMVSLVKNGTTLTITTWGATSTPSVRTIAIGTISANRFVTQYGYDFMLGGWDNVNVSNAYYKNLIVAKFAFTPEQLVVLFSGHGGAKGNAFLVQNNTIEGYQL